MTIPASNIVSVQPGVLSAGGSGLVLKGLLLSMAAVLPVGAPVSFPNAPAVSNYFGASSVEYAVAAAYFAGYNNGQQTPSALLLSRYSTSAVAAFLRSGAQTLTLAQQQAILPGVVTASIATTGVMTVTAVTSGALAVGQLLTGSSVTAGSRITAQLTGTTGGIGTYSTTNVATVASTTVTGAYDLTVTIDGVAATAASLNLSAATSFSLIAAALATALSLSGGQTCTYSSQLNAYTITSGTTGAATSSITVAGGAAAPLLGLTTATGAVLSQGANAMTPAGAMNAAVTFTQNWAAFMTTFEPVTADKLAFAAWTSGQVGAHGYIAWDTDATAATTNNNAATFGAQLAAAAYSGTCPIGCESSLSGNCIGAAALILGTIASLNFDQQNGRITFAFKSGPLALPTADDATSAANLASNGYNYYGMFATPNDGFNFFYPGLVSGAYKWLDAYVDAMWLNAQIQLAIMVGFTNAPSVPYNTQGYTLIKAWAQDPIDAAVNYGAIRPGIVLSAAQKVQVNQAAGVDISQTLFALGWYLKVGPGTPQQRANRTSPPCILWYTDGGSVQQLNIASIDIQ